MDYDRYKRNVVRDMNLKALKKYIAENSKAVRAFAYCVNLSWGVSKAYTIMQFLARGVSAFLPILVTWNTKEIIELFSTTIAGERQQQDGVQNLLLIKMGIMLLLLLLQLLATQIHTYVNGMQRDRVLHFVEQELAVTAMKMKLEYFDDPKYYDMFETVKMDIYSLANAMYDGVSAVSYAVSLFSCICFLAGLGSAYTILIMVTTIPMAVSEYKYTRELYSWGLNHMREEREMSYLYWVATERKYAQEIRIFGTQEYLMEKYRKVWNNYFSNKLCQTISTFIIKKPGEKQPEGVFSHEKLRKTDVAYTVTVVVYHYTYYDCYSDAYSGRKSMGHQPQAFKGL